MTDQVAVETVEAPDPAATKPEADAAAKAQVKSSRLQRFDELIEGGEKLLAHFDTMFDAARAAAEIATPANYAAMARTDSEVLVGRIAQLKMNVGDWKRERAEVEAAE